MEDGMIEDIVDTETGKAFRKSLEESFGAVEDYRRQKSIQYRLIDILFIAICAVLCGANDLKAIAAYAERKQNWLREILGLKDKVPSYLTFWTVFALLDPLALENCFIQWVQSKLGLKVSGVVGIDGKAQRGTAKPGHSHSFVHIVSAWAAENHLTLGQLKVDGKSNEIVAIQKLLDMLDVAGATVTIDAMGCQTDIAAKVIEKGGDYVLALKGNQGALCDEVRNYFEQADAISFEGVDHDTVSSIAGGHGREEKREIYVTGDIEWLPQKGCWPKLQSIVMVKSARQVSGKAKTSENRFYISSLPPLAAEMGETIRAHWGIENQAHWILDVAFREDEQNANAGNIAENMSMIRRIVLNLIKQEKTAKFGVEIKRQMCGWDNEYLLKVIGVKSFS
jgi:predicted transposase YbfD/YdcC